MRMTRDDKLARKGMRMWRLKAGLQERSSEIFESTRQLYKKGGEAKSLTTQLIYRKTGSSLG
ncbi:MAG: hypothetical protein B7Z37_04870 [Verrucomicrobia bacterium 12-59-8]|nr:MAG: hypothetical protein B7Z37_04870 [Verrucomicrobia bacterium 12-59-8]